MSYTSSSISESLEKKKENRKSKLKQKKKRTKGPFRRCAIRVRGRPSTRPRVEEGCLWDGLVVLGQRFRNHSNLRSRVGRLVDRTPRMKRMSRADRDRDSRECQRGVGGGICGFIKGV